MQQPVRSRDYKDGFKIGREEVPSTRASVHSGDEEAIVPFVISEFGPDPFKGM